MLSEGLAAQPHVLAWADLELQDGGASEPPLLTGFPRALLAWWDGLDAEMFVVSYKLGVKALTMVSSPMD